MKVLLLLCGIQNSGKSTFVKNNNLTEYTICPDTIRTMLCGTHFDENGEYGIDYTPRQEKVVWRIVKEMVQKRLEKGLFTVLDCMNLSSKNIEPFIQIAKDTHSRVFMVDLMQNVDLKTCLDRNEKREFNKIPTDVIVNAYSQYQQLKIPSGIPVLNPDHWKETVYRRVENVEDQGFEHVAVFGDLHGCYDELQCLLHTLPENTLKVFAGDYCDRGYNNVGVIQWILDHKDDQDKIFLEGNHEKHLLAYAQDMKARSPEFEKITRKQFDDAHISKKELRVFYRKLRDMFYFKIGSKTILITHGGISKIGENLVFTSSHDLIYGTGDYNNLDLVVDSWNNDCNGVYQVHGHRNIQEYPICESYYSFNLEGKVEQGGNLRMVLFHADDTYQTFECKNTHQSFKRK